MRASALDNLRQLRHVVYRLLRHRGGPHARNEPVSRRGGLRSALRLCRGGSCLGRGRGLSRGRGRQGAGAGSPSVLHLALKGLSEQGLSLLEPA